MGGWRSRTCYYKNFQMSISWIKYTTVLANLSCCHGQGKSETIDSFVFVAIRIVRYFLANKKRAIVP